MNKKVALIATGICMGVMTLYQGLYEVKPNQKAMKYSIIRGLQPELYSEGYHWRIPIFQRAINYDCFPKSVYVSTISLTKDARKVELDLEIIQMPQIKNLYVIQLNLGNKYQQFLFKSITDQVARQLISQYNLQNLKKQKKLLKNELKQYIELKAKVVNIIVKDIKIVDLKIIQQQGTILDQTFQLNQ